MDSLQNSNNVTEAKLGETFGQWLDGRAVFAVQDQEDGSSGTAAIGGLMKCALINKFAFQFISEAKQALFDTSNHSAAGNLSSFESLNRLENLCKLASTDRAVSLSAFDTDPMLLAAPNQWVHLESGLAYDPDPSVLSK